MQCSNYYVSKMMPRGGPRVVGPGRGAGEDAAQEGRKSVILRLAPGPVLGSGKGAPSSRCQVGPGIESPSVHSLGAQLFGTGLWCALSGWRCPWSGELRAMEWCPWAAQLKEWTKGESWESIQRSRVVR